MNFQAAFAWPEHHISAAWWVAAILSAPWWLGRLWKFLALLPLWGGRFARDQRAIRIRILERLHGNTYQLILHVLRDALSVAFDLAVLLLIIALSTRSESLPPPPRRIVFYFCLSLGCSLIGNVIRLRILVRDLLNYTDTITKLKAKQAETSPRV